MTGITEPGLLRASHIVPWSECDDAQRLDVHNGLLLSALWDAAFDQGLVSFADDGSPLASPRLSEAARKTLGLDAALPLRGLLEVHRSHLGVHRARHGFSEGGNFTPMDPAYFETHFRTSQLVTDWPPEFVILSAFATKTPQQNERADYRLAWELRMRGGW